MTVTEPPGPILQTDVAGLASLAGEHLGPTAWRTLITEISGGVQLRVIATIQVQDAPKPALVAECLFRHYA
jgi:hypothetical protein